MKRSDKIAVGIIDKTELESIYKELDMIPDKSFDRYVIAYIDFLGMKNQMKSESSFKSLYLMKALLTSVRHKAAFIKDINKLDSYIIKVFSDNIVIAQKLQTELESSQIISMINLISLLQFEAYFQFDFALRGGMYVGELYIDDTIVWGTGLIQAYQIENDLAIYPRVIVSQTVIDEYDACLEKSINILALIKQDKDGYWFVDFLNAIPNLRIIPQISEDLVRKSMQLVSANDRVKQKINWLISYFNSHCHKYKDRGDYEKCIIPYI